MPELRGEGQAASLCKDDRRQQHYRAIRGPDGTGISDTGSRGRANHTTEAEARGGLPLEVFKEFTQARARAPRGPRTVHDLPRAPRGPKKLAQRTAPPRWRVGRGRKLVERQSRSEGEEEEDGTRRCTSSIKER